LKREINTYIQGRAARSGVPAAVLYAKKKPINKNAGHAPLSAVPRRDQRLYRPVRVVRPHRRTDCDADTAFVLWVIIIANYIVQKQFF
jgi:hypothetical protein